MQHLDEGTIHAWLDGALSETEAAEAQRHVAECAACSAAVAEARGLIAASSRILSALDEPVGASDVAGERAGGADTVRALAAARARANERANERARRRIPVWWMRAAAVLVVAVGSFTVARRAWRGESVRDVVSTAAPGAAVEAAPKADSAAAASAPMATIPAPPPVAIAPAPVRPGAPGAAPLPPSVAVVPAESIAGNRPSAKRSTARPIVPFAVPAPATLSRAESLARSRESVAGATAASQTAAPPALRRAEKSRADLAAADAAEPTGTAAGCYRIADAPPDARALLLGVPARFELEPARLAIVGGAARYRVRALVGAAPPAGAQWWSSVPGDSVVITWPVAGGAVRLAVTGAGARLAGEVTRVGDLATARASGITLDRIECEAGR